MFSKYNVAFLANFLLIFTYLQADNNAYFINNTGLPDDKLQFTLNKIHGSGGIRGGGGSSQETTSFQKSIDLKSKRISKEHKSRDWFVSFNLLIKVVNDDPANETVDFTINNLQPRTYTLTRIPKNLFGIVVN